ncbi:MAG: hypothetical protein OXF95_08435 [Rhodobacteraceae bacterium]|nr:hypothetical protein [Paracoccaceae bacterium]
MTVFDETDTKIREETEGLFDEVIERRNMMTLTTKNPSRATIEDKLVDKESTKEKLHRISIDVGDTMYKNLKIRAVQENRTVADITRSLWHDYLNK